MLKARVLILLFLFLTSITGCSDTPDEEKIKAILDEITEAVESGKYGVIANHLHDDFMANNRMNAEQIARLLKMYSLQHKKISVTIVSRNTRFDPVYTDKASTDLSVIVTGSSGRLPNDGSIRMVKIGWLKEKDDWKIVNADWEHY